MKLAVQLVIAAFLAVIDWWRKRDAIKTADVIREKAKDDATIADLDRAIQIKDRVADVRLDDRLRRADTAGRTTEDGYRD